MALIARIHAAGQPTRVVRLRKGRNRLELQPGEQVEIVDEETGKAPDTARAERMGDDLVVTADVTTIRIEGFYAASAGEVALSLPGTGYADVTPVTSLAACAAGEGAAAAGAGGGMSTTAMAVLGAVAAGVGVATVASGGKSGGGGQTPNSVPPAAPTGLDLAADDDSGASNSDNITRNTGALTITGSAEAGSTVQILSGSTVLGSGSASANGTFSIDITLPAGTTTITARASNSGGASPVSTGLTITVDATAPAVPATLDLAAVDDSGASNSDDITSQTSALTISGTAEAGSTVELFAGSTSLGKTTAAANGTFSLDVTLPAGTAVITARATDTAGNVSNVSATLSINVDTAAPAAPTAPDLAAADDSGVSNSDNITRNTSALTLTGTAEAGATVTLFDGDTALGTVTVDADGSYSLDVILTAGVHSIAARATDVAGNVGAASSVTTITVDTSAPSAIGIGGISGGAINAAEQAATVNVALTGLEAGAAQTVTLSGTDAANPGQPLSIVATVDANGNLALTPAVLARFADGNFTITAQQTDAAGNVGATTTATATLDRAAPTLTISSSSALLEGAQTATLTFTFSETPTGFSTDDVSVTGGTLSGFTATADPRVYTATVTPTPGAAGTIVVTVAAGAYADAAGNTGGAGTVGNIAFDPGASGSGVDGYIAFALVFRDANNNGAWDREVFTDANNDGVWNVGEAFVDANNDGVWNAERFTTTDRNGDFSNLFGTGRIVLAPLVAGDGSILTRDISTGAVFTKQFSAPEGSSVVTPLTTLVEALAGNNASAAQIAQAEQMVKAALGISDGVDLKSFDPISAATAAGASAAEQQAAVEVQKIAVQVANVLNVVSTAATAANAYGSAAQAAAVAATSLANQLTQATANGGTLNLSNSAVVASVISDVAAQGDAAGQAALTAQADSVSTALATVNEAVSQVDSTANAGSALAQVVATQIVAQVDLATAAANAVSTNGGVLDATAYSGAALGDKVDSAASQVQVITQVVETPQSLGAPGKPTVDDGTRITGAEAGNGIQVSVSYTDAAQVRAGDKLRVSYNGTPFEITLGAGDIPGTGETRTVTIAVPVGSIGGDGPKSIVATFVAADGTAGPDSLPLLVSVDTSVADPTVGVVSGGFVNAAEAAAGVPLSIAGIELGSAVTLTLSGTDAIDGASPLTINVGRVNNEFRLTSEVLGRFVDGSLTLSVQQIDIAGNTSNTTTRSFTLDRVAPLQIAIGDISDRFINNTEAQAGVALGLTGVDAGATQLVRVSGTAVGGGALTLTVDGSGGSYTLAPALLEQFADGQLTVTAQQTDAAGNTSLVGTQTVQLARGASLLPPGINDVSGGVINAAEAQAGVTFTLSNVAGGGTQTVLISGDGLPFPQAVTGTGGVYTLSPTLLGQLTDSSFQIIATQTDGAGNQSGADVRTVVLDKTAPTASGSFRLAAADDTGASNSDGITNKQVFRLTGTGEAGARVDIYDGGGFVKSATIGTNGQFSVDVTRASGTTSSFTARIVDAAGNQSAASPAVQVIVDAAAPVALTPGTIAADNIINAAERAAGVTVAIAGAEGGATLAATLSGTAATGGALTVTVPVSGGSVTLAPATLALFAQGSLTLSVTQTDAAGNRSTAGTQTFLLDTTAPGAPIGLDLAAADDTAVNNDNITSRTSGLTITGTAEANSTVELFDGEASLGTAIANGSGAFTLDVSLADGTHAISARATDAAGNASAASTALTVTVDAVAPAAPTGLDLVAADDTGTSNSDNLTSLTSGLTITGNAEPGSRIELFNGATSLGTAVANGSGIFTLDVSLPQGTHSLTAVATDAAGNASAASAPFSVTVDATAPTAPTGLDLAAADDSGASSSDNVTSQTTALTISGTAEANSTIVLRRGTTELGTVVADQNGSFTLDVSLPQGTHAIVATATDPAGNMSPVSTVLTITVDTTAPTTPAAPDLAANDDLGASNSDNITSRTSGLTVAGVAEAGATVALFDGATQIGTATADSNGVYSFELALDEGAHALTVRATDVAGNVSAASAVLNLTVDTSAPAAPTGLDLAAADDVGASATDNLTNRTTGLTITGTSEAGALVELFSGTTSLGSSIAGDDGTFSIDVSLPAGTSTVTAISTDAAGNASTASVGLAITVDAAAPAAPTGLDLRDADDTGNPTDNVTALSEGITITGAAEAGARVELFNGATSLGTVTADGGGNFSFTNVTLQTGGNSLTARATDAAGNVSTASGALTVTVDPTLLETLTGTAGDDDLAIVPGIGTLDGLGGNDTLTGAERNDVLIGGAGNDVIAGNAGFDTAVFAGNFADYSLSALTKAGTSFTVTDSTGARDGIDTLSGIERLRFADKTAFIVGNGGYESIQAAINAASAGDVVIVAAGTWDERLVIDKPITLLGAKAGELAHTGEVVRGGAEYVGETVISPSGPGAAITLAVNGPNALQSVTIDGFTFDKDESGLASDQIASDVVIEFATTTPSDDPAQNRMTNVVIKNNVFADVSMDAISGVGQHREDLTISGNAFLSATNGLPVDGVLAGAIVLENVSGPADASNVGLSITGNLIRGFYFGAFLGNVQADGAQRATISDNVARDVVRLFSFDYDASGIDLHDNSFVNSPTFNATVDDGGFSYGSLSAFARFFYVGFAEPEFQNIRDIDIDGTSLSNIGYLVINSPVQFPVSTAYGVDNLVIDGDEVDSTPEDAVGRVAIGGDLGIPMGGAGSDRLFGAGGNDTLNGGAGDDNLEGGDGDDVLNGGDGNDEMNGDAGQDQLNGGNGDDDLEGKSGDDTIDGGDGFDNAVFLIPNELYTSLRVVQGTGADAGSVFVENVNGNTVTQLFRVSPAASGGAEVQGLNALAGLGTDIVTNVERLDFVVPGQTPLSLFVSPTVQAVTNGVATALGTVFSDALDLGALYPQANAATVLNAFGSFGDDTLTGHDGVNTLNGGAGNDSLSGLGGNDFLEGSAGDDTLNGGGGFDVGRFFLAPPLAGNFRVVDGTGPEAGQLFVERVDGQTVERLFRINPTGTGAATVTGLGAAAFLGTDTVTGVEQLSFQVNNNPFNANQFVRVLLDVIAPALNNGSAFVNGSVVGDTINLAMLYPGAVAGSNIGADGDRGDDTIIGNQFGNGLSGGAGNDNIDGAGGDDYLQGNAGNDTISGGSGNDTIAFNLPGDTAGTFVVVDGVGGDAGKLLVQRVDGQTVETIFRVTVTGTGAATIEGLGSASSFGIDTVTNAEFLDFGVQPFNQAKFARINLTVQAPAVDGNGNAFVNGSAGADSINLNTLYPNNPSGNFGVEGGSGNDMIVGNAGNNGLGGGTGDDTIDGGAGFDNANFGLSNLVGALELVEGSGMDAGRYFVRRVDGQTVEQLFEITLTGSGSATVTGVNSAAAFGTDTVSNIEFLNFFRQGSTTGGVGLQIGVNTGIVDNVDFAFGSVQADTISVPLLYPNAGAATPINASGNRGNDMFIGHAGANKFFGDDGDDTMTGGGGNDELHGGNGTDVAVFSGNRADYTVGRTPDGFITVIDNRSGSPDGTDRIDGFDIETLRFADGDVLATSIGLAVTGGEAGEQLNGSNGPDVIVGNGGNDNLNGQDGDDTLTGGAGDDFINGGGGDDVAVYSGNFADYTIETLAGGAVRVVDNRAGSPDGADYVASTTDRLQFADQIFALAGTPGLQLNANSNNGVTLAGGSGDDQISGGVGNDVLSGNEGDDSLFGSDGNDELFGNAGNDDLNGWLGDDVLLGGLGDDLLIGEAGDDELIGNIGNDVIIGGDGADYARGEEGADFIEGGEGNDILLGGYYGDHVAQPGDGADIVRGQGGNDVLRGGDGDDTLEGGDGDDNLRGDLGNDVLNGGNGVDFVAYRFDALGELGRTYDHGAGITFDAGLVGSAGPVTLNDGRGGTDTLISIEAIGITGTNYGDTLIGGMNAAFSQLTGYGGDDTLVGGTSMDDIAVYTGNFFNYSVVRQDNGTITVTDLRNGSPDGTDTLSSIEALAFNNGGATYRVSFIGTGADDFVGGTGGSDLLVGNGGNDYLRGDGGNDLVNGGTGRDTAAFGLPSGTTGTLQLVDGAGADAGKLLVQRVDGQSVETLFRVTVNGVGAATVEAMGSAASLGTDLVTNVEQLDFFVDSGVPNTPPAQGQYVGINLAPFFGQLQNNAAFVNGGEAGDQIDLAAFYGNVTAAQLDANGNRGNDTILGHDGRNFLSGSAGDDSLSGLAGDDGLNGGDGNDTLLGGADNDYMQGEAGNDSIDGGTGTNDIAAFTLPNGTPGTLRVIDGTGPDAGKLIVQRVDGNTIEDLFRVTIGGEGQATVEGLGARAGFGTDTVTNVDELQFLVSNNPFNPDQFTSIRLTPRVNALNGNNAFVEGSQAGDNIDLAALYPAANATIQLNSNGNRGDDVITGHAGVNNLQGGAGNDTLNGADGNDRLEGQLGNDTIDGGAGTDIVPFVLPVGITGPLSIRDGETPGTFVVQRTPANQPVEDLFLIIMTGASSATVQGLNSAAFLGTDTVSNAERLEFFVPNGGPFTAFNFAPTAFPANGANPAFVAGSVNADTIDVTTFFPGADASMVINGNGDRGNDSITGHAGSNTLSGAQGDDQIFGLDGDDTLFGNIGADTLEGGEGDDALIGGNNNGASAQPGDLGDSLRGGAGNDVLRGGDGDDTLEGDDDDDNLRGDAGNDTMDGGAGRDFVSYRFDDLSTGVTFDGRQFAATASFTQDDGRNGVDQLSNVEALGVNGSLGDDIIYGSLFNTGADGIGYANQLAGEDGDDQLFGGDSNDQLTGDDGNDQLMGAAGADDLDGGLGNDILIGGDGDDTLNGDDGVDQLTGGEGADKFVFDDSAGGNLSLADVITDFAVGIDQFLLQDELTFNDLIFTASGADTVISKDGGGTFLAVVQNVQPDQLTAASFIMSSGG